MLTVPHATLAERRWRWLGSELDALLAARGHIYDRIIYVGDGANDICPTLRFAG